MLYVLILTEITCIAFKLLDQNAKNSFSDKAAQIMRDSLQCNCIRGVTVFEGH